MNGNPHADILRMEIPEKGEKRTQLLEELKQRAKGAFQCKDLMNAQKLYSRCLEIDNSDYLLYSNRSAVCLLMQKNDDAVKDADCCLKLNPSFLKAHYRKAQALKRLNKFEEAILACENGLKEHKGNGELEKLKEETVKDWALDKEAKKKFNEEANEVRDDLPVPVPTRMPVAATKPAKVTKLSGEDTSMRGYKKTADGKTTSYFHTELTAEAKALIGDCKPKKLEELPTVEATPNTVGSAWNQAGTFEERNYTKWFHDKIRKVFGDDDTVVSKNPQIPDISISVTSVYGDANIACTRGKIKYIHDVSLDLKWEVIDCDGRKGEGTAKFESDGDGEYDVVVEVDNKTHSQLRSFVTSQIKSDSCGLQPFVCERVKKIEKEFQGLMKN